MALDIVFLVAGLVLLIFGGDWLLKSATDLSVRLGIPRMIVGLTVVSLATSAPELIVSINAALKGMAGLALGNVVGSNIANIALVLSVTAIISPFKIPTKFFKSEYLYLLAASILLIVFSYINTDISRTEGFIMVILLVAYIVALIVTKDPKNLDELVPENKPKSWPTIILLLFIGGGALWLGSEWLVKGASNIALYFNVSESAIGLSIVAFGTSVPELAASIIAAVKGEKAISLGNLIGSNIFNILCVIGVTSLIQPFMITDARFFTSDFIWMMGVVLAIFPLSFIFKRHIFGRTSGIILLTSYIIYIGSLFL